MGNWKLDPDHTQVEFSAKHLGMMTVRGYFFRQLILRMAPGAQRRSYALTAGRRSARGPAPGRGARSSLWRSWPGRGRQRRTPPGTRAT